MTTSDERRAAGKEIQGQLWPATLTAPTAPRQSLGDAR